MAAVGATPIIPYFSTISGHTPTTITLGEIAINIPDGNMYVGTGSNAYNVFYSQGAVSAAIAAATAAAVPAGTIMDSARTTAPAGFLLCDGSAVSRAAYAALFAAIGTAWGAGDGSTTFNVPDLRGYVTAGAGAGPLPITGLAQKGGETNHTLSAGEMPSHTHTYSGNTGTESATHTHSTFDPGHIHNPSAVSATYSLGSGNNIFAGGGGLNFGTAGPALYTASAYTGISIGNETANHTHGYSGTTSGAGSGAAHNNVQPTAIVLKIIKT